MASNVQPDLVIRGGTIFDGTGEAPFVGDIAVTGDIISAVAPNLAVTGKEEYDARGLMVAPGWIDPHTHFDAQWSWDPYLSPSSGCGVTTCIMGNCGIGFAPCQKDRRNFLSHLVEAVEDIPERVIAEGMNFDFETFEEFMDSIERKSFACDIAVMVAHSAVRTWVMGRRANLSDRPGGRSENPVLPHEIDAIASLVRDAVAAGAVGFSTSRLLVHRDPDGILTPGALAGEDELCAICKAIAEGGGGIFEMSSDFSTYEDIAYAEMDAKKRENFWYSERAWMIDVAKQYGKKCAITFNCLPGMENQLHMIEAINNAGGLAKGQCFSRAQGLLQQFGGRMHPFIVSRTYRSLASKYKGAELLDELKKPEIRQLVVAEADDFFNKKHTKQGAIETTNFFKPWSSHFTWQPGYEQDGRKESVAAIAKKEGRTRMDVAFDMMASGGVMWKPFNGWSGNYDGYYRFFQDPHIIPGFADAGAHGTMFQDAAGATFMLTHWARDRTQGKFPVEYMVKKSTKDVAELFGLSDRGVLKPGLKADINVMDFEKLKMREPYLASDLPLGQQRWMQDVDGYTLTLLSGRPTFVNGTATGKLPGRLVRNPQRDATAWKGIAASVSGPFESGLSAPDANSREHALKGVGSAGASAAARLMRETVEAEPSKDVRSRL